MRPVTTACAALAAIVLAVALPLHARDPESTRLQLQGESALQLANEATPPPRALDLSPEASLIAATPQAVHEDPPPKITSIPTVVVAAGAIMVSLGVVRRIRRHHNVV